jgi:hypothetical protein
MESPVQAPSSGPAALVQPLLETLRQEEETLLKLHGCFEAQVEALRLHDQERLQQATLQVNEGVAALERLRQARERQARLAARVFHLNEEQATLQALEEALRQQPEAATLASLLHTAREQVRLRAAQTRQRCEDFEFALHYAMRLGHEMLQVLQNLDTPPPARVYTAHGGIGQASPPRSFLNKVG